MGLELLLLPSFRFVKYWIFLTKINILLLTWYNANHGLLLFLHSVRRKFLHYFNVDFLGKEYFRVSINLSRDWFQPWLAKSLMLPYGKPVCRKVNLVFSSCSSNINVHIVSIGKSGLNP